MIEIKVNTRKKDDGNSEISVEASAKHSGKFGDFVDEMYAVLKALEKTDRQALNIALRDFTFERLVDELNKDESEDEGDNDE